MEKKHIMIRLNPVEAERFEEMKETYGITVDAQMVKTALLEKMRKEGYFKKRSGN